jgi:hypothetical protein
MKSNQLNPKEKRMTTSVGFNEITVSLEKLQGTIANPEFMLYELGKEIERMANRELRRNSFKNQFSLTRRSPIEQKPFSLYRRPFSGPLFGNGKPSFHRDSGVRISRFTEDSVTVSMPREILAKVSWRLPEIEEFCRDYMNGIIGFC